MFPARYRNLLVVRARPWFRVLSATRADGRACTVVVPGPQADPGRVAAAFDDVALLHACLDHENVPRVAAHGLEGTTPFLELDCAAVADGLELMALLGASDTKMPYGAADAFVTGLRRTLQAAWRITDPRTGRPACLGRLSMANVLLDGAGGFHLVGFGRNFPVERDDGEVDGGVPFFEAPEVSSGASPSPSGDYAALMMFVRTLLPYADLSEGGLGRILRGENLPDDDELIELLRWNGERIVSEMPVRRASIEEAVRVSDRIRELNGTALDLDGFRSVVTTLLQQAEEPRRLEEDEPPARETITLGPDATWVAGPDGARHRLGRTHRRLLLALVEGHRPGGAPLTLEALHEAGWPGEVPPKETRANRVYVALTRLRQLGLREVIDRFEDGYRLSPGVRIRTVEA